MTTPTETELIAYMVKLADLERTGTEPIPIKIGPFSAITVIGALQLAMRHPQMDDVSREFLAGVIEQLAPAFEGTPGEEIIRRGNDPDQDR